MARQHEKYFGRTMNFTDRNGNNYPASFWILDTFRVNTTRREIFVQFVAFASINDFEADAQPLSGNVWEKHYTGEAYDRLIAQFGQAVAGVALATWQIADLVIDTPNNVGDFESFFASAGQVIMPNA